MHSDLVKPGTKKRNEKCNIIAQSVLCLHPKILFFFLKITLESGLSISEKTRGRHKHNSSVMDGSPSYSTLFLCGNVYAAGLYCPVKEYCHTLYLTSTEKPRT